MEASDRNSLVGEADTEPCFVGREAGIGNMVSGEGAEHCSGPEGCVGCVSVGEERSFTNHLYSQLFNVIGRE